ncbi:MAG TPA: hypothetical protein PKJ85_01835 [Nitrosomonas nitrosa]|nr:hypothetical protein [Nitrosomonas nitrosa]
MRRDNWAACDMRYKKRIGGVDRKSITNLLLNYKIIFLFCTKSEHSLRLKANAQN